MSRSLYGVLPFPNEGRGRGMGKRGRGRRGTRRCIYPLVVHLLPRMILKLQRRKVEQFSPIMINYDGALTGGEWSGRASVCLLVLNSSESLQRMVRVPSPLTARSALRHSWWVWSSRLWPSTATISSPGCSIPLALAGLSSMARMNTPQPVWQCRCHTLIYKCSLFVNIYTVRESTPLTLSL